MAGLVIHLIPHTHWDREWYLPRAAFVARLVPAIDDLLTRLETDPDFRSFFLDGQTVLLEDYLRVRPDQRVRVAALVRAGRLEIGPWYVLADELVPSGESLVRNLLLGRADAERLGGRSDVFYSPDAFGHPAIWPALAAEFDMAGGVLWRGLGGEPGQEGDSYRWHAPDGRAILLHHLPPDGYEAGSGLVADPARLADEWARLRAVLVGRAATPHLAVTIGADHHAAPVAIGRVRELLAALEPEADVRVSRLDEFLRAAAAAADGAPGAARRAPLVLRLHLDAAGRARHPGTAQASARGGRAAARARGRAAGRAGRRPRARRPAPAARRDLARAGAVPVSRLDRRLHLGLGRAAGGGPARRRHAGGRRDRPRESRRPDRQRSR